MPERAGAPPPYPAAHGRGRADAGGGTTGEAGRWISTRVLPAAPPEAHPEAIAAAAATLRASGLVAFPTETVYGLGANALDPAACQRIYIAKRRAPDDPCIVHLASAADLPRVSPAWSPAIERLAAAFWPGPLSLVLPKQPTVPDVITAGRPTVAVRVPAHPVALALLRAAGVPVAAPSANLFAHTSPTRAEHVWADLAGRIDLILDGGPTPVGVESTVLDLTGPVPTVLRPGGVSVEQLRAVLGEVAVLGRETPDPTRAPGLLPKHYAPRVPLLLVEGPPERALPVLAARAEQLAAAGHRVGVLLADDDLPGWGGAGIEVVRLGPRGAPERVAANLYAALRTLEARADVLLAPGFAEGGLGRAIQDRLRRAASERLDAGS
jgi:L-threonylcarbamoyladenylate synthase